MDQNQSPSYKFRFVFIVFRGSLRQTFCLLYADGFAWWFGGFLTGDVVHSLPNLNQIHPDSWENVCLTEQLREKNENLNQKDKLWSKLKEVLALISYCLVEKSSPTTSSLSSSMADDQNFSFQVMKSSSKFASSSPSPEGINLLKYSALDYRQYALWVTA